PPRSVDFFEVDGDRVGARGDRVFVLVGAIALGLELELDLSLGLAGLEVDGREAARQLVAVGAPAAAADAEIGKRDRAGLEDQLRGLGRGLDHLGGAGRAVFGVEPDLAVKGVADQSHGGLAIAGDLDLDLAAGRQRHLSLAGHRQLVLAVVEHGPGQILDRDPAGHGRGRSRDHVAAAAAGPRAPTAAIVAALAVAFTGLQRLAELAGVGLAGVD